MKRVLIYGDVDLNVIDGSSVWLQSVTSAFAAVEGCEITLLTKRPIEKTELIEPLRNISSVRIIDPINEGVLPGVAGSLSPFQLRTILETDALGKFDVALIRGSRVAKELTQTGELKDILWVYLTDIPQTADTLDREGLAFLQQVVDGSKVLLGQTESIRSLFEQATIGAVGKTWILPPMIPPPPAQRDDDPPNRPLRIVYAGKFAPAWNTLEMCDLPSELHTRGVRSNVAMIGDKIHRVPDAPGYFDAMEEALRSTRGVKWEGRMPRDAVQERLAASDVGLGWRAPEMSESLELSTKLLEYGAAGIPVVLNRTPAHKDLLGADYPAFAETFEDAVSVLEKLSKDASVYSLARSRCVDSAAPYLLSEGTRRLAETLVRTVGNPSAPDAAAAQSVLLMSHDFKFIDTLERKLALEPGLTIRRDEWMSLFDHDAAASLTRIADADVVVCEWCGPNAVFASRNKRPDQRLIVRLHRFELYRNYPLNVDINAVDAVVTVSPHYRRLVLEGLGWPEEKVVTVPNWVDTALLDRPKLGDVRYNIGMIGVAPPSRKRLDRALQVMRRLRAIDERYTLFVKSKPTWAYDYMWSNPEEVRTTTLDYQELRRSPLLSEGVVFDSFGPDVARWLRKIGFVLSTSDDESFHLSPAEGMASGAVPIVYHWPGAETIYETRHLGETEDELVEMIVRLTQPDAWSAEATHSKSTIQSIGLERVSNMWRELLEDPKGFAAGTGEGSNPVIR